MNSYRSFRRVPFLLGIVVVLLAQFTLAQSQTAPASAIWILEIKDAIGPATSDYIVRGIEKAEVADASLVIITMDTPGGLDTAMRKIISAILASKVPVASFVTPKGARAASAGTYILYASHFAAMNEATNLGAATPVQIGVPSPVSSPSDPGSDEQQASAPAGLSAMEKKMVNDASAYIRGLADLRDRNGEWAEQAVREGVSLAAKEALAANVIDLIALDVQDLIDKLDGKTIQLADREVTVALAGKPIHVAAPDWRTEILATLTNPNMVLILGMFGIYGILLEFYNPGATIPGVVGVICLILAGYALQMLPVNYAGLALIVVGVGLMVAEAMVPSFGVLGIGGIIAFTIGGVMLFDSEIEAFQVGLPAIAASGIVTALIVIATITIAMRMRKRQVTTGVDTLVGQPGEAMTEITDEGQVRIGGEIWRASAASTIPKGSKVKVTAISGMVVTVEPA